MDISILGCGWLGFPLARNLKENGHHIKGSTTSEEKVVTLSDAGIEPFLLTLNPKLHCNDCSTFWESELLILNIPPGRGTEDPVAYHSRQVEAVSEKLEKTAVKRLLFVSSTSVYPQTGGVVTEEDAVYGKAARPSGNACLKAEKILIDNEHIETAVVRFGGLYGYDRHPAKYLAGRNNLDRGNAPVNLIHRDDCIGILKLLIDNHVENAIFNGVSDGHPPRKIYYRKAAKTLGLEPPTFKEDDGQDYKVVSNRKLKKTLGYQFTYPNPMNMEGLN